MTETVTVLRENDEFSVGGSVRSGELWIRDTLLNEWGWHRDDRGLCRDGECIPVPGDGSLLQDEFLKVRTFADRTGRHYTFELDPPVASIGSSHDDLRDTLNSGIAPDFELPDRHGNLHRLRDFEGTKIFLLVWASW